MNTGRFHKLYEKLRYSGKIEILPLMDTLDLILIDENGMCNHLKMTNSFQTPGNFVHNSNRRQLNVKREPTLAIERGNLCFKCDENLMKGHQYVCLAKEATCQICKNKDHFNKSCKPKRKNVSIVNSEIVTSTEENS